MGKFVIAISREYGSGGREIGRRLAERLGVGAYDKELIAMTADKSGLSTGYVASSEENVTNHFLLGGSFAGFNSFDSIVYYDTPTTDKMFIAQSDAIRELAERGSCVIVGRCADYVLRGEPGLVRVFIRAEREERVARAVAEYSLPQKEAEAYVKKTDKSRANYYKFYTNRTWGDPAHEDLVVNSSFTGVDGAVSVIETMLREKGLLTENNT
ncbi:MAG: cytidylate kinase-like family protein [Oscillospiraceae bacterium]|jgi:cytidylate kinase|nr:cytidylate kinase-like family protein [Oscillospiraceae bacterium]